MNDFRQTLERLTPSDLPFLHPIPPPAAVAAVASDPVPGRKRCRRREKDPNASDPTTASPPRSPSPEPASIPERLPEPVLPVFVPPPRRTGTNAPIPTGITTTDAPEKPDATLSQRRRVCMEHEWPAVGAILTASYFGTRYSAQVVQAEKRLKSGRQLLLLDGPARGERFDSYSSAMLSTTAEQRKRMNLGRRGTSNGWDFWAVERPASPPERSI